MTDWRERCDWCGWPLTKSTAQGCVLDNCSQRPVPRRDDTELRQECRRAERKVAALEAEVARLREERDEALAFGEEAARKYNALISEGETLRCAFCAEEYPPGTPATQHEALTAHVAVCSQHPMREAEARATALAEALEEVACACEHNGREDVHVRRETMNTMAREARAVLARHEEGA